MFVAKVKPYPCILRIFNNMSKCLQQKYTVKMLTNAISLGGLSELITHMWTHVFKNIPVTWKDTHKHEKGKWNMGERQLLIKRVQENITYT